MRAQNISISARGKSRAESLSFAEKKPANFGRSAKNAKFHHLRRKSIDRLKALGSERKKKEYETYQLASRPADRFVKVRRRDRSLSADNLSRTLIGRTFVLAAEG